MSGGDIASKGTDAGRALRDWQQVRDSTDIQYAPADLTKLVPPQPPGWLVAIGRFLKAVFGPIGEAIGVSWPVLQWVLVGLAVVLVAILVWRLVAPMLEYRRPPAADQPEGWAPDRAAAMALLEDADRLAREGRFDEATHLLLQRSVSQIAAARPDWLHPASTAREIAAIAALPERARGAFATIAARVERSFFALIPLGAEDWQAARGAYAEFALAELAA